MMPTGIVVIVSAFFALIGIIISKENKVSEFRQKWIDELREEISTLVTHAVSIQSVALDVASGTLKPEIEDEYYRELQKQYLIATKAVITIKLRINKKEGTFLSKLKAFEDSFLTFYIATLKKNWSGGKALGSNEQITFSKETDNFLNFANDFLKLEWERVKEGEKVFSNTVKKTKYVLIAAVITVMFSLVSELPWRKIILLSDAVSQPEISVRLIENKPIDSSSEKQPVQ
jgi:hypothetical protein